MVVQSETFAGLLADARALCEVIEFGTISAAARRLGESKGAVSRRITRLESELGARLLVRTPRAVRPTDEGLAFHTRAQAALALLDEAADSARGLRDVPRGHLRVTTAVDLSVELLPPIIAAFRRTYPHITVDIVATDTVLDLAAHRIDLALRIGFGGLPDQAYHGVELASTTGGIYAAPSWLAGRPWPARPSDLASSDLLVADKQQSGTPTYPFRDSHGSVCEFSGRAVVRASDFATVLALAEAGAGVAMLPDLITTRALRHGALVRLCPDWSLRGLRLHALSIAGRPPPARVRLFRAFLRDWVKEGQGALPPGPPLGGDPPNPHSSASDEVVQPPHHSQTNGGLGGLPPAGSRGSAPGLP